MTDKNFVFWCQKAIPLVFDNSLSYYECLCKLLNYVNSLTTDVKEIAKLQQELQTYVDNYFNNLDVQEEINKKLDDMVNDGTLSNIINNELFENINNRILQNTLDINANKNKIDNKISENQPNSISMTMLNQSVKEAITGGSTAVVGVDSISNANIQNNAISILNLDKELSNAFFETYSTPIDLGSTFAGYYANVNNVATYYNNAGYSYNILNLEKDYIYTFSGYNVFSIAGLIIADENNKVIYSTKSDDTSLHSIDGVTLTVKINESNLKAYISYYINNIIPDTSQVLEFANKVRPFIRKLDLLNPNINYNLSPTLINSIPDIYIGSVALLNNMPWVNNYPNNGMTVDIYSMDKNKNYHINGTDWAASAGLVITDRKFNAIYRSSETNIGNNLKPFTYNFKASEDGYIFLTRSPQLNIQYNISIIDNKDNINNKLYGLNLGIDGDSICADSNEHKSFGYLIAQEYNMNLNNIAVGGGTIASGTVTSTGANRHWICESIKNLNSNNNIVIVGGGVNDYWNNVPLGEYNSILVNNPDTTNFYGALESIAQTLLNKFTTSKLFFIVYHNINDIFWTNNSLDLTYTDYYNAIVKVMNKYGIPVIDIHKKGRFNTYIELYKNTYTQNKDGVHPNELGYQTFYNDIILQSILSNLSL